MSAAAGSIRSFFKSISYIENEEQLHRDAERIRASVADARAEAAAIAQPKRGPVMPWEARLQPAAKKPKPAKQQRSRGQYVNW